MGGIRGNDENYINAGVNPAYQGSSLLENPFMLISGIVGVLLIMMTGYLIIYNIFQISVIQDIQSYGQLKHWELQDGKSKLISKQVMRLSYQHPDWAVNRLFHLALAGCSQQPAQPLASSELGRPLANVQPGPTSLERHGLQARVEPQRPTLACPRPPRQAPQRLQRQCRTGQPAGRPAGAAELRRRRHPGQVLKR